MTHHKVHARRTHTLRDVRHAHVTHIQITSWYCLCYFSPQHLQRSMIGYLSNSRTSRYHADRTRSNEVIERNKMKLEAE